MGRSVKKGPFIDDHLAKKVAELNATRERTRAAAWSLRISSRETPEMNERYDGISGRTQGERNENRPAAKATNKLTSAILLFEQLFK